MITMEKIDYVMDTTNSSYEVVRKALLDTDGDVDLAIEKIRRSVSTFDEDYKSKNSKKGPISFDDIKEAIENLWEEGKASRLLVKKNDETILSLSLAISAFGAIIAPLAAILGVGAGYVNDYDFYLVTKDGENIDLKNYIKENLKK